MKSLNYTKTVVIVHGKSEKQICQYIKNKLRLKMEIYSDKNGEKAIQITSLKNTLNNKIFKSFKNFIKTYEDIKLTNLMNFEYKVQDMELELYVGKLNKEKKLVEEVNKLYWIDKKDNFFDVEKYAGEGNIGHMVRQVELYKDKLF